MPRVARYGEEKSVFGKRGVDRPRGNPCLFAIRGPMVVPFGSMVLMSAPVIAGCGYLLVGTQAQRREDAGF